MGIFSESRGAGDYFRVAGGQAHSFGDLMSPTKKLRKKERKASIFFYFFSLWGGIAPQTPLVYTKCILFRTTMHNYIYHRRHCVAVLEQDTFILA